MPPYTKNTGMQSMSELFAMKKNIAFQANHDHVLTTITKDYYHRRENFSKETKKVYDDMMDIRISTGYSLDPVRSADASGHIRHPNPPTVYFPPIGVRLVRQYVGVDIKTGETLKPEKTTRDPPDDGTKPSNLSKGFQSAVVDQNAVRSAIRRMSMATSNVGGINKDTKTGPRNDRHVTFQETGEQPTNRKKSIDIVITPVAEKDESLEPNADMELSPGCEADSYNEKTSNLHVHFPALSSRQNSILLGSSRENSSIDEDGIPLSNDTIDWTEDMHGDMTNADDLEHVFIETNYNLKDRRSSRSTFRTRSTVRMVSQSSLSEHNMEVVNQSTKGRGKSGRSTASTRSKAEVAQFYLDYGDGKLHDNMKIPNIKDCARPWCNPHCITCQRRTKKGPCFILIPKKENDRKRQVPTDKRRLSMFPIYRGNSDLSINSSTDTDNKIHLENQKVGKTENFNESDVKQDEEDAESNKDDDDEEAVNKDIDTLLKERIKRRSKGYSKKRIDELAQPRGVPPAEVRFSKTSLRRKREQMKEGERHKAMQLEARNQAIIQGKISMFLALLNEHENFRKPTKMPDLPIREDVKATRKRPDRKRRWKLTL